MSVDSEMAKGLVALAFRNGPIEDIHAESRITQDEMRTLMKFAVDRVYWFIMQIQNEDDCGDDSCVIEQLLLQADLYCRQWDEPSPYTPKLTAPAPKP